jgi:hypothetical protein
MVATAPSTASSVAEAQRRPASISERGSGSRSTTLDSRLGWFVLLAICALLLFSRRPDALLDAQFWAEDGRVWYAQAHALGLKALLLPQDGYFQTVSKLSGLLSLAFPLAWAPTAFNLIALSFRLLPVALLHSARGRALVPLRSARWLATLLYVGHPYSGEVHLNVTTVHWHLALAAFLLVWLGPPRTSWGRIADVALVALSGLSGVFCLFLAPVAFWRWRRSRDAHSMRLLCVVLACALIQGLALALTHEATRTTASLGATPELAVRILGGQLFGAATVGAQWTQWNAHPLWRDLLWLPALVTLGGLAILARAWWTGAAPLRAFLLFAALIGVAGLLSPQVSLRDPQWPLLAQLPWGLRYVFIPILAWYAALLWCAWCDARRSIRWASGLLLSAIVLLGVATNWVMPPFQDLDFDRHARRYEEAAPGTPVLVPINPPGWDLLLVKPDS